MRRPEIKGLKQRSECIRDVRQAEVVRKVRRSASPGSSQATTVNSSVKSANCGAQMRLSSAAPWTKTKGAPTPSRWYAIVRPPVSTSCTSPKYSGALNERLSGEG